MTPDQQLKIAEVVTSFIQGLLWPAVIIFLVLYFGEPLKKFLGNMGELTFKAVGVEATAKKQQQAEAATSLFSDVESNIRANLESETIVKELREIVSREAGKRAEVEVSEFLTSIADRTVETIRQENFIRIDSRPLVGESGEVWELPYNQFATVSDFLDDLWFLLRPYGVPSMKYGSKWILRDVKTRKELKNMGRSWARKFGNHLDIRSLADVGIQPGMKLEAIQLE